MADNETLFGPDGTQDPAPPAVPPDPLAGLVTGAAVVRERGAEPLPIAQPPAPDVDASAMRDAIRNVLAEEQQRRPQRHTYRQPRAQPPVRGAPAEQAAVSPASSPPAQRSPARRPGGAAGWFFAILVFLAIVLAVGRMVIDWLLHAFH